MPSTELVETLQEEVGALQAEVTRLRVMVHRITRGIGVAGVSPTTGEVSHRGLRQDGGHNRNNMGRMDVASREVIQLLKLLVRSQTTRVGSTGNAVDCHSVGRVSKSKEPMEKKRRRREKERDKKKSGKDIEEESQTKEDTHSPPNFSTTQKEAPELVAPLNLPNTQAPEQAKNEKVDLVRPASRHAVAPTPPAVADGPSIASKVFEQQSVNRAPQQTMVEKQVVQAPGSNSLTSIPRDGFLAYDDGDEPSREPPLVEVTREVDRRRGFSSSSSSDELPVGTEWVPADDGWRGDSPKVEEVKRATRGVSSVGRLGQRNHPSTVREGNLSELEETHLSIEPHRAAVGYLHESVELDSTRGGTQFVSVDLTPAQTTRKRKCLARLRDTSEDSEDSRDANPVVENLPTLRRTSASVAGEAANPNKMPGEAECVVNASTRGEVAADREPSSQGKGTGYALDAYSDCEFTEDFAA